MTFFNIRDAVLVLILFQGLDFCEGAVTLSSSPTEGTIGDNVIFICRNTDNIRNVTWKINGGDEVYFDPSIPRRVFINVLRTYTISQSATEYGLSFKTYQFDERSTWQCVDNGMSSNVVTLFSSTAGSASGVTQTPTTIPEDNLALIVGLCAMGGLLAILLTVIVCWCLGRRRDPPSKKARTHYVRDPEPVHYMREVQPAPTRTTIPNPLYEYRREPPRRTVVLANNPRAYERDLDIYDPHRFSRRSFISSTRSDTTRGFKYVDVVFDSFEGRDSEDLYPSSDVYAKVMKRPAELHM